MNSKGFTLVEVLIAMAIASVVGMAGVSLFSSTNWAYKFNEDVADAQQNVRISSDRLVKDIRMAGFGLPDPPFTVLNLTSPITFTSGGTGGPDSITVLGGGYEAGSLVGSAVNMNRNSATFLCYSPSAEGEKFFAADGTSNNTPYSNRKNISLNGTTYLQLQAGQIRTTGLNCAGAGTYGLTLATGTTLDHNYSDGTPVFIIQAITYSINTALTGCTATNPCLASTDNTELRGTGTQVVVEGIEDLQFAYGIDFNPRDGKIDYVAPYTTAAFLNSPSDPSSIIAVRASIVAKAKNPDPKGGSFIRPALEDRTAGNPGAYRRRVLTKVIKMRNPRQGS